MPKTKLSAPQNLTRMNPSAAAIDIGSTMHMAAVNPDSDDMPIRAFGTFTHDLHDLATWFRWCHKHCDGLDRCLLDTGIRDSGAARIRGDLGQCPLREERSGPED
ncbi:hypothetical protein [Agrobacterium tumefaciens]|uniref:hypothetical protein n=1 Tax=Agrobacterium tumefaciens TaxID=358 RepID=UPI000AFC41BB